METATLAFFAKRGGTYGSQRKQEMRTSDLYVSGHCREVLQCAVRGDGRNPGLGLQVPALDLQGSNGARGARIVSVRLALFRASGRRPPILILVFKQYESARAVRQSQPVRSPRHRRARRQATRPAIRNRPQPSNIDGNRRAGIGDRLFLEFPCI